MKVLKLIFVRLVQKVRLSLIPMAGMLLRLFVNIGDRPSAEDVVGAVKVMLDSFAAGEIDKLFLVGNEFVNTMTQVAQYPSAAAVKPGRKSRDETPLGLFI